MTAHTTCLLALLFIVIHACLGQAPMGGSLFPGQAPMGGSLFPGQAPMGGSLFPGQAPMGGSLFPGQAPMGGSLFPGQAPMGAAGGMMSNPMLLPLAMGGMDFNKMMYMWMLTHGMGAGGPGMGGMGTMLPAFGLYNALN